MAESQLPRSWLHLNLPRLIWPVAVYLGAKAVSHYQAQGYFPSIPEWTYDVALILAGLGVVYWAWTQDDVQKWLRLLYSWNKKILLWLLLILGAVSGTALGRFGYWAIEKQVHRQAKESKSEEQGQSTGRRLSEWQRVRLAATASLYPRNKIAILISRGDETRAYANDFRDVFVGADWTVQGPKLAPPDLIVMDTRLSADEYLPARPEVLNLLATLKDMHIKTAQRFVSDNNVPRGWIVLWVGAESPADWNPETIAPLGVPKDFLAGESPESTKGLERFGGPEPPKVTVESATPTRSQRQKQSKETERHRRQQKALRDLNLRDPP